MCLGVVDNCSVEFTEVLPGVTVAGENEHDESVGRPEQLSDTDELKLDPDTLTVKLAIFPAVILTLEGDAESEKSMPVPLRLAV